MKFFIKLMILCSVLLLGADSLHARPGGGRGGGHGNGPGVNPPGVGTPGHGATPAANRVRKQVDVRSSSDDDSENESDSDDCATSDADPFACD